MKLTIFQCSTCNCIKLIKKAHTGVVKATCNEEKLLMHQKLIKKDGLRSRDSELSWLSLTGPLDSLSKCIPIKIQRKFLDHGEKLSIKILLSHEKSWKYCKNAGAFQTICFVFINWIETKQERLENGENLSQQKKQFIWEWLPKMQCTRNSCHVLSIENKNKFSLAPITQNVHYTAYEIFVTIAICWNAQSVNSSLKNMFWLCNDCIHVKLSFSMGKKAIFIWLTGS